MSTYEEFGRRFFELAVTEDRILGAVGGLAGQEIRFGPIGAGPGKVAKVSATGRVGQGAVERRAAELVVYDLRIPVGLDLLVDLPLDDQRFRADLVVTLRLTARAAAPLRVVIDVDPPTKEHVTVRLQGDGVSEKVFQRLAGVDAEIRRFVAKYVAKEIDKPHIRAARDIDVAARIDGALRS